MQIPKRKNEEKSIRKLDPLMTQAKFDELSADLEKMIKIIRPKLIKEVERLGALGDFSENAEYQIAKGKLRGLNNRIDRLAEQLNHAEIIQPNKNNSYIQVGHTVILDVDGQDRTYQILGSTESDPSKGIISKDSPIGQELLGSRVGDVLEMKTASKVIKYKVLKII